jgi:hypothetical protein
MGTGLARSVAVRLVALIPVVLGITMLVFALNAVALGDPARAAMGQRADAETLERLRRDARPVRGRRAKHPTARPPSPHKSARIHTVGEISGLAFTLPLAKRGSTNSKGGRHAEGSKSSRGRCGSDRRPRGG